MKIVNKYKIELKKGEIEMPQFKALVVDKQGEDVTLNIQQLSIDDLPKGEVLIRVHYSGVNYKDSLASIPNGNIVKNYPFVPGIDLSGVVVASEDSRFKEGDEVIATSYEIGVSHYGGYSEYARIPADWVVPLPKGLSLKEAMIIGTAGFTAALSIYRLEKNGLTPNQGKVLVTGATGGVGSFAVAILSKLGYEVEASTGKETEHEFLKSLGAASVLSREEVVSNGRPKSLAKQRWIAAILGGQVAVSGLTGGASLPTTVYPFILRGVDLLGIDSAYCDYSTRKEVWNRLATDYKPNNLQDFLYKEVTLEELPDAFPILLKGQAKGRILVNINS